MCQRSTHRLLPAAAALLVLIAAGCQNDSSNAEKSFQKPPKPVSVMTLQRTAPSFPRYTSATVAPWKAERLGFEQAGRVIQVIEPNEMVTASTGFDERANGTVLARLDDERLRIAIESIKADTEVIQRSLETNQVAIEERIPASIKAAIAEYDLANRELQRAKKLANAISQSELDSIQTRATTARLKVTSAEAELTQAKAEQLALKAQIRQSNQRLAEAMRNLRNSVLYGSFSGQVAEVHAVPGTYATAGDPIVTVLMMDPMVVEFETTSENSRRYRRGDTLDLGVTDRRGNDRYLTGAVYNVDSVADPETRTFTVTLHVRNQRSAVVSPSARRIAKTKSISSLNVGSMVAGDSELLLVKQDAIHELNGKQYVWKVTNRTSDKSTGSANRRLRVQPIEVKLVGNKTIPFLGKWDYVEVEFVEPKNVNVNRDLITDRLYFDDGDGDDNEESLENWNDNEVLLDDEQWLLRAGDVARIALLPIDSVTGYYVPMKAILRENGQTFVHVVDPLQSTVKRLSVEVGSQGSSAGSSLLLKIDSTDTQPLAQGMQIVVGGTHFLKDGDRVRVVSAMESQR